MIEGGLQQRVFIIYAPHFDEDSGGSIALHRLCHLLTELGQKAMLWPIGKPSHLGRSAVSRVPRDLVYHLLGLKNGPFRRNPLFKTDLAGPLDLSEAIAVYPETVAGDPLGVGRCVRWLLHTPGFLSGHVDFGKNDLMFYYQTAFCGTDLGLTDGGLLQTLWVRDDVYLNSGMQTESRSGDCYMVRKGEVVEQFHGSDAICLDGLSHREVAVQFQTRKTFFCYDPYTMYSAYAAACGCDSVVIPPAGLTKDAWYTDERKRYGIAFGQNDLTWARETRDRALEFMKLEELEALASVRGFAETCHAYFSA